jgi:predicted RNA-binding Zn-ribbon protein involved in translation (DUF1610 family)
VTNAKEVGVGDPVEVNVLSPSVAILAKSSGRSQGFLIRSISLGLRQPEAGTKVRVHSKVMDKNTRPKQQREKAQVPACGEKAVVRCQGFRCLAYRAADGKWRSVHSGKELPEVLEVVLRF